MDVDSLFGMQYEFRQRQRLIENKSKYKLISTDKMKLKMKIAQTAQDCLAMLGIRRNQNLANVNFLVTELIFFTTVASELCFLFNEAYTFREYTLVIFWTSTYSMAAVCFTLVGKCRVHIFKMIDLGEEIIEMSEYTFQCIPYHSYHVLLL